MSTEPENISQIHTLIIGFGYSSIPLIRELDHSGHSYIVLSCGDTIWEKLTDKNKLEFDLVSSRVSSFYSFDLLNDLEFEKLKEDDFPSAKEFAERTQQLKQQYSSHVVNAKVTKVENFDDHSIVYTDIGVTYHAHHVVFATGFKRTILKDILEFDTNVSNKTIVFNTLGDTANMMISKLVPNGNRIICLNNGFLALDKYVRFRNKLKFVFDQSEFHTVAFYFPTIYYFIFTTVATPKVNVIMSKLKESTFNIFKWLIYVIYFKLLHIVYRFVELIAMRDAFDCKHPSKRRVTISRIPKFKAAIGFIAIKFFPIMAYKDLYDGHLEDTIKKGILINDITFFINHGYVTSWRKNDVLLDKEKKCLKYKDDTVHYDYFIDGEAEAPNLPAIEYVNNNNKKTYTYTFRDNYLGIVPKKLNNIYFMGLVRPFTGGIANITEIQSLFIHKMITQDTFRKSIYSSISDRISTFINDFYFTYTPTRTDHVINYGLYTETVARAMGIHLKLSNFLTPKKLFHYFIFPNNAFKYREYGEYKIPNMRSLIKKCYEFNFNFAPVTFFILHFFVYHILFTEIALTLYFKQIISLPLLLGMLLFQLLFRRLFILPVQYCAAFIKFAYLIVFMVLIPIVPVMWILWFFIWDLLVSIYFHRTGWTYLFNDISNHKKCQSFFDQYINVYKKVKSELG